MTNLVCGPCLAQTHSHPLQGAIIVGQHKLIVNPQRYNSNDSNSWTPADYPCTKVSDAATDCDPYCVFDIYKDERETSDLSHNASLLQGLLARYNAIGEEPVNWHDKAGSKPGGRPPDDDYTTTCEFMNAQGGFWRPVQPPRPFGVSL